MQLLLLGWFILLALAELMFGRDGGERGTGSGDARLLTNFGLTASVLGVSALLPLARITSSVAGQRFDLGIANLVPLPMVAIFATLLILDSFAAYWAHRLLHATPLLWRLHRVHHADSAVDVSTSLRNHPGELLVTVPVSAFVILLVGAPVSVVMVEQTIIVAATIWQHADIALPPRLDAVLARVIITPRLHRLHHNPERPVHDSNFGDSIALWDWMFGTLNLTGGRNPVGLNGQRARADHLLDQIWSPLRAA
jgi:sterol desaturase/sphingolipid hydroxylase (fatty acid hydroxylase superfamily)